MNRRQSLGQHFLASPAVAEGVVEAAGLTGSETVLEIGPGLGALTPHLCRRAGRVVAVEVDRNLHRALESGLDFANLELVRGDAFQVETDFDVLVSSLPYSQSRRAVEWLAQRRFSRAVILVQREFADKLSASAGERRAVSVLASWAFEMETVRTVSRGSFRPPPEVDSVLLRLTPRNRVGQDTILGINRLFSQRRKTLGRILGGSGPGEGDSRRLDELSVEEIVGIAGQNR